MKTLCLFNPENDLALAHGGAFYMPPAHVGRMAEDLSVLPLWYAPRGSEVWVPDERRLAWMDSCPVSLCGRGVTKPSGDYDKILPWGWSPSLVYRLQQAGVSSASLPSSEQMERIRQFSARGVAVEVLHGLRGLHDFMGASCLYTMEQVDEFLRVQDKVLLKAPWSGSGRGLQWIEGKLSESIRGWVQRVIRTQGYVVGEPCYNKVADFAMEFLSQEGRVEFVGYSWFETDAHGMYKENLLASDACIEQRLASWVSVASLHAIRSALEERLASLVGIHYQGWLGVDMMVCAVHGGYAVHPCVEINLRTNMGIVARRFFDNYVSPSSQGRFIVEYYPCRGDALRAHSDLQHCCPLVFDGERIQQGYLSLTPVLDESYCQVYVVVSHTKKG